MPKTHRIEVRRIWVGSELHVRLSNYVLYASPGDRVIWESFDGAHRLTFPGPLVSPFTIADPQLPRATDVVTTVKNGLKQGTVHPMPVVGMPGDPLPAPLHVSLSVLIIDPPPRQDPGPTL
mgnify:CR=1 FL=1